MLLKLCDHCDLVLALYYVPFARPARVRTPRIQYVTPTAQYLMGDGVMVWAHSVDDVDSAIFGDDARRPLSHPVIVCPASEYRAACDDREAADAARALLAEG